MYKTILVPLDGSTFGEHALPLALTLARRAQATLQVALVHVPLLYLDSATAFEGTLDEKTREKEQVYLNGAVKRLAAVSTVPVKPVFLAGPVVETLHEHVQASGVDLIVMTTHGRGPLSRLWLGSVADELLRRTTKPVLLVRPHEAAPELGKERLLRHMLVPMDGSSLAEKILEPALDLGTLMATNYTLVRVVKPMMPVYTDTLGAAPAAAQEQAMLGQLKEVQEQIETDAGRYLEGVAGGLRSRAQKVDTSVICGAQAAAAVLEEADARGCDVIALETHGRRGMARLLLGSVADKVVRGAHVPVLVHRPSGK